MKTRTSIKAGGINTMNHNESMKVRSSVKAGGIKTINHNQSIRVRSSIKAGGIDVKNHNESIRVRSNVKAGGTTYQHNETIARSSSPKLNKRPSEKKSGVYGIKVMSVRTGVKAGWISRNYK